MKNLVTGAVALVIAAEELGDMAAGPESQISR
jgi:hypothetical protein